MSRMPPEEAARYRLDDCLGGTSATIHQVSVLTLNHRDRSIHSEVGVGRLALRWMH